MNNLNYSVTVCSADFASLFLLRRPVTVSTTSGTRPTIFSAVLSPVGTDLIVTLPLLITTNATGVIVIPAPPPPPKSSALFFDGKSEPPDAKPYVTFETGIICFRFEKMLLHDKLYYSLAGMSRAFYS